MADNTPEPTEQDDQPAKDQPQTGGKGVNQDMEEAQEDAAHEREDEGGYQ